MSQKGIYMKEYKNFEAYLEDGLLAPENDQDKSGVLTLCEGILSRCEKEKNLASIALFCVSEFKLYEAVGCATISEYLAKRNFSPGTISHKLAYGKFCHDMKFTIEDLPSEFSVRSILNKNYFKDAPKIYLTACKKRAANQRIADSKAANKLDSEEKNSDADFNNAESSNDLAEPENTLDDEELKKYRPSATEIKEALEEHKKNQSNHIFLDSIKETVPCNADFITDVLDKYKRKIRTVPLLVSVVTDFTRKTAIPKNLFPEINKFAEKLHEEESRLLTEAMNGKISAEEETDTEDSIES